MITQSSGKIKHMLFFSIITLSCLFSYPQPSFSQRVPPLERPKLIVGIVVDQMRQDYLFKYYEKFGEGGFKRLMHDGFMNKNAHFNYIPTYTGPGHASVYTGTTPEVHGIIGNNWYSRKQKRVTYCSEDNNVTGVGSTTNAGKMSPRNMLATSIADELRLSTNNRGKVIGVAIKDRGAILPAGHTANGAYWYDYDTGKFITSTFYRTELPEWVQTFNQQNLPNLYLENTWATLFPIETYLESGADVSPYEMVLKGKEASDFPYHLASLRTSNGQYKLLPNTPWGNTLTIDIAKAAILGEELGKDEHTDLLAVSFSSTDIIGHNFGLQSIELADTYARLDRDLESFLNFLDKEVGKGEYLVFLTSDHAAVEVPQFLIDSKIPAGYFKFHDAVKETGKHLRKVFGRGKWIEGAINDQIYLNKELVFKKKRDLEKVQRETANFISQLEGVAAAYTATDMIRHEYRDDTKGRLQRGFSANRSGDVLIVLEPAWMDENPAATSHGSGYNYDTHIPLLWYGWNIPSGQSTKYESITNIAPTLSMMLNITLPNGSTGRPIEDLLNKK
jgi:predicted AlkP superfamily pyrophosphatase or phosphodiesterase